jgi:hypothetical protein
MHFINSKQPRPKARWIQLQLLLPKDNFLPAKLEATVPAEP